MRKTQWNEENAKIKSRNNNVLFRLRTSTSLLQVKLKISIRKIIGVVPTFRYCFWFSFWFGHWTQKVYSFWNKLIAIKIYFWCINSSLSRSTRAEREKEWFLDVRIQIDGKPLTLKIEMIFLCMWKESVYFNTPTPYSDWN